MPDADEPFALAPEFAELVAPGNAASFIEGYVALGGSVEDDTPRRVRAERSLLLRDLLRLRDVVDEVVDRAVSVELAAGLPHPRLVTTAP